MHCPQCQQDNPPGARFCNGCGMQLEAACPACDHVNPSASRFCNGCGSTLDGHAVTAAETRFASPQSYTPKHLAERILTSKAALEGERKQVTVLFCDIAGSTALAERIGADGMHGLLNRFFELVLTEVHRYEGTINQFLGDGFMALFGAPLAHEDHAHRAALAALAIQRRLRDGAPVELPDGTAMRVRMGMNTGVVVVGKIGDNLRMDYTAVGDTTNLAARLQQLAEPGAIYLSPTTYRMVERHVACDVMGERRVKGKSDPVLVYRLSGAHSPAEPVGAGSRPITSPLIGRDTEVSALQGCLERLLGGVGGVVTVLGEAGLGKSRLVTEIHRTVADWPLLWLEGRALSFGQNLGYWPFLEIIRRWAGITEEDDETRGLGKLEACVRPLFTDDAGEVLPYLATLLGLPAPAEFEHRVKYLDGQAMGRQIFRSVRRLIERLARERPVVLVFEDVHWADRSSIELLEHLVSLVEMAPVLLCGVGRPEHGGATDQLATAVRKVGSARLTEIQLAPLPASSNERLVENLLANDRIPGPFKNLVLQKTEGNPFFVEEVIRSLIGTGALVWDAGAAHWRLAREIDQVTIPDTLHGVIMARVDRLDEDVKHVLKMASVIGRSFLYRVLEAIAERGFGLDGRLRALQELELIREKRRRPELEYFFKHALVQEATYESVLVERRRQVHRRIGEAIEALFGERLEEFYGILAHHYARAEEWHKAQEYLFKAGDHAGRVAADVEALAHYRDAVRAYERAFGDQWDPIQRAGLEHKIGEALFRRGDHEAAAEYLLRALALLNRPFPTSRLGIRLAIGWQALRQVGHRLLPWRPRGAGVGAPDSVADQQSRTYELMAWIDYFVDQERLVLNAFMHLNGSERRGPLVGIAKGSTTVGVICDLIPAFRLAKGYHRRAVAIAEEVGDPVALGLAYFCLGLHEHFVGDWDLALAHYQRAKHAYLEAGDLRGAAAVNSRMFHIMIHRGDVVAARALTHEVLSVADESADRQVRSWGVLAQGIIDLVCGPRDAAAAHLTEATTLYRAVPSYAEVAEALGYLGQYHLRRGDLERAREVLDESRQLIEERGVRGHGAGVPRNSIAELYLAAAERSPSGARGAALKVACRACRDAVKQGNADRGFLPSALRLLGTYHWLAGSPVAAQRSWRRSVAEAEALNAAYEVALTHLEVGRRTLSREDLERAETMFFEMGTELDRAEARALLAEAAGRSPR